MSPYSEGLESLATALAWSNLATSTDEACIGVFSCSKLCQGQCLLTGGKGEELGVIFLALWRPISTRLVI